MKEAYAIELKLHVSRLAASDDMEGDEFVWLSPRNKLLSNLTPEKEENDRETNDF